ncbi:hypothetical protein [Streptomyces sp. NPDC087297]
MLAHSSRIYDALRAPHSTAGGAELRTVEHEGPGSGSASAPA